MRFLLPLIICLLAYTLPGAEVLWNIFERSTGSERLHVWSYDFAESHRIWPDITLGVTENNGSIVLSGMAECTLLTFLGNWLESGFGEIADETSTRRASAYLLHSGIDDASGADGGDYGLQPPYGGTMTVGKDTENYLMFAVQTLDAVDGDAQDVYYGWVQLLVGIDGTVSVGNSAIDLSGGPMIVGGGSALTPEPTGALMLLLGGGTLALRQRLFPSAGGRWKK